MRLFFCLKYRFDLFTFNLMLMSLLFSACNKFKPEPIEDDLQYVVGKWNWDSTYHKYNWCTGGATLEETIYAESHSNSFSVVFNNKGYIYWYNDDSLISCQGLTLDGYDIGDNGERHVVFNKEFGGKMGVIGNETNVRITAFPFTASDGGCENYKNYFSKE